jgi:osmotically-inducible protein OsmY
MATEEAACAPRGVGAARLVFVAACLFVSACESPAALIDAALVLVEERSRVDVKTDTTINLKINAAFLDQKNGLFRDIAVDVYEGEVLLTGSVREAEVKRRASTLVAGIPDVRKVLNEVQVAEGNGIRETSADITLETKIKVALRLANGVHSVNMRWRSVGGTIYLFGRALSQAEQEAAIATIRGIEGVERLINVQKIVPLDG